MQNEELVCLPQTLQVSACLTAKQQEGLNLILHSHKGRPQPAAGCCSASEEDRERRSEPSPSPSYAVGSIYLSEELNKTEMHLKGLTEGRKGQKKKSGLSEWQHCFGQPDERHWQGTGCLSTASLHTALLLHA